MPQTRQLLDAFDAWRAVLCEEFVERESAIHALLVALVAGQHIFFLGSPGIAKSALIDRCLARVSDVKKFKTLVSRASPFEQIFGPLDLDALGRGHYRWLTDGYLPWADVAFVDEIWNSGPTTLNAMLGALNEREFQNDGQMTAIPLSTMACASNRIPTEDEMMAIYDRVLIRMKLDRITDTASRLRMYQLQWDPDPDPLLSWADVRAAGAAAAALPVDDEVYEAMARLVRLLEEANVLPSDRRQRQSYDVLRAEAWLDGADRVHLHHMSVLVHCLWDRPEDAAPVAEIVLRLANPLEQRTMQLASDIEQIAPMLATALNMKRSDKPAERDGVTAVGMELFEKVQRAHDVLRDIRGVSGSGRRQRDLTQSCTDRLHDLALTVVTQIFDLPAEAIDDLIAKSAQ